MNGKAGGYCIARYDGCGIYDMSKVDSIMLKFRPIAPKPVAAGCGSGSSSTTTANGNGYVKCGRSKRRYVRVNKNKIKKENFKKSCDDKTRLKASSFSHPVVTLSLLPETPNRDENKPVTGVTDQVSVVHDNKRASPPPPSPPAVWLSFNNHVKKPARRPQVVSNVTVECLTDTWVDLEGLGCTDEERVMNMEKDTCPGFISDGQDKVVWTNEAYRQMAGGGHVVDGEDVQVVLVRKDKWISSPVTYPAFTCKVRVTSSPLGGRKTPSPSSPTLTLPCDVWRMARGACAWRLDVKAALSLGR
ncbi:hypothetical protein R6Q57_020885 [Mikania cordata]